MIVFQPFHWINNYQTLSLNFFNKRLATTRVKSDSSIGFLLLHSLSLFAAETRNTEVKKFKLSNISKVTSIRTCNGFDTGGKKLGTFPHAKNRRSENLNFILFVI